MVSALSNYFMASLGTDEVLREVWAGNLPTQLHETIGLIFLTDAFTRASGMMLIGMGLYKTGYLKDPESRTGAAKARNGCHPRGGPRFDTRFTLEPPPPVQRHQYCGREYSQYAWHDTDVTWLPRSAHSLEPSWNQSITRTPTPTRSERPHQLPWTDSRMPHFSEQPTEGDLFTNALVERGSRRLDFASYPLNNVAGPVSFRPSRVAMALCHLSTA